MKKDEYIHMLQTEGPQTSSWLRTHGRTNINAHERIMRQLLSSGAIEQKLMRGSFKLYSLPGHNAESFGICPHCGGSGTLKK